MWPFSQTGMERKLASLKDEYDYIVVGGTCSVSTYPRFLTVFFTSGGNSGCVLARRLTDAGRSVLVVERGDAGDKCVVHYRPLEHT